MTEQITEDIWLEKVERRPSAHCDERETDDSVVDLLVIHNISLPPAIQESDFDNDNVERFFTGQLDWSQHDYFKQIEGVRVSAHLYIKRNGHVVQFVPLNKRAWHAGVSKFQTRTKCNDFSIGIELQGTDDLPFTERQYQSLKEVTKHIQRHYPKITTDHIVGHSDIAPGRKTDPGPFFYWNQYLSGL